VRVRFSFYFYKVDAGDRFPKDEILKGENGDDKRAHLLKRNCI
jgi:hypothetical protein